MAGSRRRRLTALGVAAAMMVGLLSVPVASPRLARLTNNAAAAVEGATNPEEAPTICPSAGGSSLSASWSPGQPVGVDHYAKLWVPGGAYVKIETHGEGTGGDHIIRHDSKNLDGTTASLSHHFIAPNTSSWVRTKVDRYTGLTRLIYVYTSRDETPAAGTPITWAVRFTFWQDEAATVPFSQFDKSCGAPEGLENDTDNDSEENDCGAQPDHADPVNVIQGNFWDSWRDLAVAGRGPGLSLARTYSSSRSTTDGPLGFGWTFSYGMTVSVDAGIARVRQENGAVAWFESQGSSWVPPRRVNATLAQDLASTTARWTFVRGGTEVFKFGSDGTLRSIADLSGNTTTLDYETLADQSTQLSTVTDPAGRQLVFTWKNGKITKVTAPAVALEPGGTPQPIEVGYAYSDGDLENPAGDLASVTSPNGGVWTYGYDAHRMTTVREPRHQSLGSAAPVLENHYDSSGRVEWQDDRLDRRTTFDWSVPGQTRITDPKGQITLYEHTAGVCTGIILDPGPNQSKWSFEVDEGTHGRTKVTDPNGVVTTAIFNDRGMPTKVTTPKGSTRIVYDPVTTLPISIQDPSLTTTSYGYDAGTDRLRSISRPITPGTGIWTTTLDYEDAGNPGRPTTMTDERGKEWSATYEADGDLASATDPTGRRTTWTYNEVGWPLTEVAPAGNATGGVAADHTTKVSYNEAGDVTRIVDPLGAARDYGVDLSGYVESITDPVPTGEPAELTSLTWNAAGELTEVTRPGNSTMSTEYWPNGLLKAQRDGANAATTYAYDAQGRLATITDPSSRVTTFGYDPGGRVTSRNAQSGTCPTSPTSTSPGCVFYEYFTSGEPKKVSYGDTTPAVTFKYDELGRRTEMVDQRGTSTWTFDSIGRLLTAEEPAGTVTTYSYSDDATVVTYPGGKTVTKSYDDAGRQNGLTAWIGGATMFGYDDNANQDSIDTGAGTGTEDDFDFDRAGRMTAFTLRKNTVTTAGLTYLDRDPEGMVRTEAATGLTGDAVGYNGLDMLASDSTGAYSYDPAGNLTGFPDGRKQKFQPNGELCYQATTHSAPCGSAPADAVVYGYDARDNRTSEIGPDGFGRELTYDLADRLVSVEEGTASVAPLEQMQGTPLAEDYDADGSDDVFWYRAGATNPDYVTWGSSRSTFGKQASTSAVSGSYVPAAGDFDGDGHGDILWYQAGSGAETIWFWFGRSGGGYDAKQFTIDGTYTPVVGDFDNDQKDDVFLYLRGTALDTIWWGRSDVDDGHSFDVTHPSITGADYEPVAGNFDGSGGDDILWYAPGTAADTIHWYSGSTRGNYTATSRTIDGTFRTAAGDFNGDTKDDLLLYSTTGGDLLWWGNTDRPQFSQATQTTRTISGTYHQPFAGDFDGDTRDDLFLYGPGSGADDMWWGTPNQADFGTDPAHTGLPESGPTATYTYSGDGLRHSKETADGTTTTYLWDRSAGLPLLAAETIDADGTSNDRTIRYLYNPQGLVLADVTANSGGGPETIRWYHHDQLGSTRALTDASGTTIATFNYRPYGELVSQTGSATTNIGWAGEYKDSETGFVYLRARYYDPATAQFLTRDPLEAMTRSPFAYVQNNPINFVDPTGLGPSDLVEDLGDVSIVTGLLAIPVSTNRAVVLGTVSVATGAPVVIDDCLNGRDEGCIFGGAALVTGAVGTGLNGTIVDVVTSRGWRYKGVILRSAPELLEPTQVASEGAGVFGAGFTLEQVLARLGAIC